MIVAVDETGDANMGNPKPKFAVGALHLLDELEAANVVATARRRIGDEEHVFHYSHDGPKAREALASAIDESPLDFYFKVVGYDRDIPLEYLEMRQSDVHSRLLGHALNLLLFLPSDRVLLSAREASLSRRTLSNALGEIARAGDGRR